MKLSYPRQQLLKEILWTVGYFVLGLNVYSMIRFWETDLPWNNFWWDALTAILGGGIGGLLLAGFHQLVSKSLWRRRAFGQLILLETLADLLIIALVFLPVTTFTGVFFTDMDWVTSFWYNLHYMFTLPFLGLILYLLLLSGLFNFLRQVDKKFGRGVMLGLILGRYHNPREDERIFMFLDLRASTTHAEQLGHVRFSRLLQDCFYDLNSILLAYEAHIYKYVGDEAILTWSLASGLKQANCLRLFFAFHRQLDRRKDWYMEQYGLLPEFKAGVNVGRVTVAEVGEYRREIEYHGDVVNTAARIQQQCNEYEKELLISRHLWELLQEEKALQFEELGELQLKGKLQGVTVFSVEEA